MTSKQRNRHHWNLSYNRTKLIQSNHGKIPQADNKPVKRG